VFAAALPASNASISSPATGVSSTDPIAHAWLGLQCAVEVLKHPPVYTETVARFERERLQTPSATGTHSNSSELSHKRKREAASPIPRSALSVAAPFVGLNNQGATCYLNSLLQVWNSLHSFSFRLTSLLLVSCGEIGHVSQRVAAAPNFPHATVH
jgi:hypothetical protein